MSLDSTVKHILTQAQRPPSPLSDVLRPLPPSNNVSEGKLFDELFGSSTKEYAEALKKLADVANDKTIDIRVARDDAFKAYARLNKGFELCWRTAWSEARTEMILEATNEKS